jgi:ferritin-like protein
MPITRISVALLEHSHDGPTGEGISRAQFLKGALGAGIVAGGVLVTGLPKLASSAPSPSMDTAILNFLLELEYLQQAFYSEATESGALAGELSEFAQAVGVHEDEHVAYLKELLGGDARSSPEFDFGDATTAEEKFAQTALVLEEVGAGAYIGQGPNLTDRVTKVASIVSVEARHAAWIRAILEKNPAPRAADPALAERKVRAEVAKLNFS